MHRVTLWIALAVSAAGLVWCYQLYASGATSNPAVPTDNTSQHTPGDRGEAK